MNYAATHPDAVLTCRKSDIILAVHNDASYLSEHKSRSRAHGNLFQNNDAQIPANNGAVLNIAQLIKAMMSSAVEAKMGAIFLNTQEVIPVGCELVTKSAPICLGTHLRIGRVFGIGLGGSP